MFEEFKRRLGLDDEGLKQDLRSHALHKKLLEVRYGASVSDDEVRARYDEEPRRYGTPRRVRASHILIEVVEAHDADVSP